MSQVTEPCQLTEPSVMYSLSKYEQLVSGWADWAHDHGKPFFISEMGTLIFGGLRNAPNDTPNTGSYEAVLKDAEQVVRGIAAGVDAFTRWSFINRGDLDGQWQFIDTWDRKNKKLLDHFTPHSNSYFLFGLLTRFTAKYSDVLKSKVTGSISEGYQHVFVAALRSPRGNLTFIVVNDDETADWDVTFDVRGLGDEARLYRYQRTPAQRDRSDLKVEPDHEFTLDNNTRTFCDRLPAASVTIYTTYKLTHDDSGIMTEKRRDGKRVDASKQ